MYRFKNEEYVKSPLREKLVNIVEDYKESIFIIVELLENANGFKKGQRLSCFRESLERMDG